MDQFKIGSKVELFDKFRELWHEGDELCLAMMIVDLIDNHSNIAHIPYSKLASLAKAQHLQDPNVVEKVVQYLTGAESHILDLGAELIEQDDVPYRLDAEELSLAVSEQLHPLTGEVDLKLQTKIFIYFRPSSFVLKLLERPSIG